MTLDCLSVSTDIHGAPSVFLMVLISAIIKYEVQPNMSLVSPYRVDHFYHHLKCGGFPIILPSVCILGIFPQIVYNSRKWRVHTITKKHYIPEIDYGLKKVLLPTPREFCRRSLS